jgi:hypothetical protein
METDKPTWTRETSNNGSTRIVIPPKLAEYLELQEGNCKVKMQDEEGPHGRYISLWNPDQDTREDNGDRQ